MTRTVAVQQRSRSGPGEFLSESGRGDKGTEGHRAMSSTKVTHRPVCVDGALIPYTG